MGKCTYNFNGESVTGNTPEQCAKLKVRFQKAKERMERQFDSVAGRSRNKKETPKPKKKEKTPSKIKKKATQLITNFKNRRAVAKKRRAVQNSRKRGLDRNAKN